MKSKLLFLPDIFLVLLICLSCERTEIQASRGAGSYPSTSFLPKAGSENPLYSASIKEPIKWDNIVDLAKNRLGNFKSKSYKE